MSKRTPLIAHFGNCYACPHAYIDVPAASLSALLDQCRERWGDGQLKRVRDGYVWLKDEDAEWRGCCAARVYGPGGKPPEARQP